MKKFWENGGEPYPEGHEHAGAYAVTIDLEDGSPVSRYYGATEKEIADKLLEAQGHAAARIAELRKGVQPEPAPPARSNGRRELTADERFQIAHDLSDPEKAPAAVNRIVEAEIGRPLSAVREQLGREEQAEALARIEREANEFARGTPEFVSSEYNTKLLCNYIKAHGWAFIRKNFEIAFEELKRAGLAQLAAPPPTTAPTPGAEPAPAPERTATGVRVRPRGTLASTGVRSDDGGARASERPAAPTKYTASDIEAMAQETYDWKIANEPGFRELVDSLGQPVALTR